MPKPPKGMKPLCGNTLRACQKSKTRLTKPAKRYRAFIFFSVLCPKKSKPAALLRLGRRVESLIKQRAKLNLVSLKGAI